MIDKFKKQNALINAINSSDKNRVYKETHHDLLNLFMGVIQKHYLEGKNFNTIVMSKEQICRGANLNNTNVILPYLQDLITIKYTFTSEDISKLKKQGLNITNKISSFIIDIEETKDEQDKKKFNYKIKFNPELFSFLLDNKYCVDNGNYTVLKIADISFLSSKYQKMLGELLLSMEYKKDFSFDYDFLRKKFNILDKTPTYLMQVLKKNLPILQNNFMNFDYEFHKKDKKISINIK